MPKSNVVRSRGENNTDVSKIEGLLAEGKQETGEQWMANVLENMGSAPPDYLFDEMTELKQLTEAQIEKGLVRLKFKHPLKDLPLVSVLPFLKPIKKCAQLCCKSDDTAAKAVKE